MVLDIDNSAVGDGLFKHADNPIPHIPPAEGPIFIGFGHGGRGAGVQFNNSLRLLERDYLFKCFPLDLHIINFNRK